MLARASPLYRALTDKKFVSKVLIFRIFFIVHVLYEGIVLRSRFSFLLVLFLIASMLVECSNYRPAKAVGNSQGAISLRNPNAGILMEASPMEQSLGVDPSGVTVGTSTVPQATADSTTRKTFFALGLFWAFYGNGTGLMVGTSADGNNWNDGTTPLGKVFSNQTSFSGGDDSVIGGVGDDFAVWFDGTYFQFVYTPYCLDNDVFYVRGLPCANGSIIWGSIQVAIPRNSSRCWYAAHISTDSSGRPWIIVSDWNGAPPEIDVIYSITSDGSWTTASGFPEVLSTGMDLAILPLTNDKMYAVWEPTVLYSQPPTCIQGAVYNGSSFGLTETLYNNAIQGYPFASATAYGNTVIVAFQAEGSYDILSTVRDYATSTWSSPIVIQTGNGNSSYEYVTPELSVDPVAERLYCFWVGNPDTAYVYYSSCSLPSGIWSTPTAWLNEPLLLSSGLSFLHWCIMSFYQVSGDSIGLEYTVGSSSPWQVKFAYLTLQPALHDVAVTTVAPSKTIVGKGYSTNVSVTIANLGESTENFNVSSYANSTVVGTEEVTGLASNDSLQLSFVLNTTYFAYGNYLISAYAWPVTNETDTTNNNCTGGWIIVSLVGDLTGPNGVPDGIVDIRDVHYVAALYGTTTFSPNWNPNADINNDGKVDIRDVHMVAVNYGQHYA